MQVDSLKHLYLEELHHLYDAEKQITSALPKVIEAVSNLGLRKTLTQHLEESKTHLLRLEEIFDHMAGKPVARNCESMHSILEEQNEVLGRISPGHLLDTALIASTQRTEHYEIAAYGCVRTFAGLLGDNEALDLLQLTLDEEKVAEGTLNELAGQIALQALEATHQGSFPERTKAEKAG